MFATGITLNVLGPRVDVAEMGEKARLNTGSSSIHLNVKEFKIFSFQSLERIKYRIALCHVTRRWGLIAVARAGFFIISDGISWCSPGWLVFLSLLLCFVLVWFCLCVTYLFLWLLPLGFREIFEFLINKAQTNLDPQDFRGIPLVSLLKLSETQEGSGRCVCVCLFVFKIYFYWG